MRFHEKKLKFSFFVMSGIMIFSYGESPLVMIQHNAKSLINGWPYNYG